jgi:hypothetical protein
MRRALVAVLLATLLGCEAETPRLHRPNVLLIVIDTCARIAWARMATSRA